MINFAIKKASLMSRCEWYGILQLTFRFDCLVQKPNAYATYCTILNIVAGMILA